MTRTAVAQSRTLDLRFQQFTHWLVLGKGKKTEHGQFWVCQCQCNVQAEIHEAALVEGRAQSCGCTQKPQKIYDITGQQFHNLLILERLQEKSRGNRYWRYLCVCQREGRVLRASLQNGNTKSCGKCGLGKNAKQGIKKWYGNLLLIEITDIRRNRYIMWRVKCLCGKEKLIRGANIASGKTTNCGCHLDTQIEGQHFHDLYVVKPADRRKYGRQYWECECICGQHVEVWTSDLLSGHTKSCGCRAKRNRERAHCEAHQRFVGLSYGFWTVIDHYGGSRQLVLCKCQCGTERIKGLQELRQARSYSCGCKNKESRDLRATRIDFWQQFVEPITA